MAKNPRDPKHVKNLIAQQKIKGKKPSAQYESWLRRSIRAVAEKAKKSR